MTEFEKNRTDKIITRIIVEGGRKKLKEFIFNWSSKHWKNHYDELASISNRLVSFLDDWKPITDVLKGIDPPSLLLITELKHPHMQFIAKLILCYGIEEVQLIEV